jgi:catechol 2,3-dioxygenase-like lactoylglutathione lyase family enzyme
MTAKHSLTARFTVITLGVISMARSIAFYGRLGFKRKMRATGEEVAFFETGASVLALYPWEKLADDATLPDQPRPSTFRGVTLAWNCANPAEVDEVMAHALAHGARMLKAARRTDYGGYAGYFLDPDDHVWEVVAAPGIEVTGDGRVALPD